MFTGEDEVEGLGGRDARFGESEGIEGGQVEKPKRLQGKRCNDKDLSISWPNPTSAQDHIEGRTELQHRL